MKIRLALLLSLAVASLAAAPGTALAQGCLSPGETREVVASGQVIAAVSAVRAAQASMPGAQITEAELCGGGGGYVYRLGALTGDGRFVTVVVDAQSGQVLSR